MTGDHKKSDILARSTYRGSHTSFAIAIVCESWRDIDNGYT